jgi:uncharacterized protein (TIGR01777 family)
MRRAVAVHTVAGVGVRYSSVVGAPVGEVFAWHERAGALARLAPPWQPVRVLSEAASLDGGRAVLRIPPGLRWVAQHGGYCPPHRFVDELTSLPLTWRHTHRFEPAGERATRVIDEVDTPVPAGLLRSMFTYRHRQLAGDLAAQARAAERGVGALTVAITGSSGLVGQALSALLSTAGHRVIRLVRRPARGAGERTWWPEKPGAGMLAGVDAVVHLAGAPIAGRFSPAHKRAIRDSRVGPTRALGELLAGLADGPRVLVTASAIGYYGPDRGEEVLTEGSDPGSGFLAGVVSDWEAATTPAAEGGVRVVNVRTGIALSPRGGVLGLLYPLFAAAAGGRLGGGRQWMSWIGIDDLCDIYLRALSDPAISGPVNATAPHPVRNAELTRTLAGVLHRPAVVPVPPAGPRLLLGDEGAGELALANQYARPARLVEAGQPFRHPHLEAALRHLLGREAPPPS